MEKGNETRLVGTGHGDGRECSRFRPGLDEKAGDIRGISKHAR